MFPYLVILFGVALLGFLCILTVAKATPEKTASLRVAFLHPDLGIGGAESLIVQAAVGLQQKNHKVKIFTTFHDNVNPGRAYPPTVNGTLDVSVCGNWLPYHDGRFKLPKALLRFLWMTLMVLIEHCQKPFHVFIVDQIPATIPLLKMSRAKVLFYCHYPDLLLTKRDTSFKRLYRWPFDKLEEKTMSMADRILVNSNYTKKVFKETFKSIKQNPHVVFPCAESEASLRALSQTSKYSTKNTITILSLNRFERKKNIKLALETFYLVVSEVQNVQLVIAGGYNPKNSENVEHLKELETRAKELHIVDKVLFKPSVSNEERNRLLASAFCLLYTPENEHFGIVPIEAALARTVVIACKSGGPEETIVEGTTGFLRRSSPEEWAQVLLSLVRNPDRAKSIGEAAFQHVLKNFSTEQFVSGLNEHVAKLVHLSN